MKLGYDLPKFKNEIIQSASIYVVGQNLLTISDYDGFDPSTNSNNNPSVKIDYNSYPVARTYMLGIQLDF